MAAKYRKVDPRIWVDEGRRKLTHTQQLLLFYCLTGPQTNRCGLFSFSKVLAGESLPVKFRRFAPTWAALLDTFSWKYDETGRVLWLPTWWKYNPPENQKHMLGCLSDLHDLPQTPLLQEFTDNTKFLRPDHLEWFRAGMECIAIQEGKRYQKQEQKQEQKQKQDSAAKRGEKSKRPQWGAEDVEAIYQAYPKRVGKGTATEAIKKALKRVASKDDAPAVYLLERTKAWASLVSHIDRQHPLWRFIPLPATWFNQGRFLDELADAVPTESGGGGTRGMKALFGDETP